MEPPKDESLPTSDCCGGAACNCGPAPKSRSRLKLVLFAAIMLAAAGVGTWSLLARSTAPAAMDCKTECGSSGCCPK